MRLIAGEMHQLAEGRRRDLEASARWNTTASWHVSSSRTQLSAVCLPSGSGGGGNVFWAPEFQSSLFPNCTFYTQRQQIYTPIAIYHHQWIGGSVVSPRLSRFERRAALTGSYCLQCIRQSDKTYRVQLAWAIFCNKAFNLEENRFICKGTFGNLTYISNYNFLIKV
jgi:hypothetical protein